MKKHILPKGFKAGGIYSGVKKKRKDLSLFFSEKPCRVSALFTTNKVKAAPVLLAEEQLARRKTVRGIVANSGNANCMTGKRGLRDARTMAEKTGESLGVSADDILVSSTGIIGEFMPMDRIVPAIDMLTASLSKDGVVDAAEGIMTTDSFVKISSRTLKVGGKKVVITGVAKGAGMIHPKMATMLSYILTDVSISSAAMKKALKGCAEDTFNAMTVDGDMSTNDTVLLLANGEAGNVTLTSGAKGYNAFVEALSDICRELTIQIVKDGEGASKVIEVEVRGARSADDAKKIAKKIASSLLVKCAVLGGDPNWGRIASSAGSSGVSFDPGKMVIRLDGVTCFSAGRAKPDMERKKTPVFKKGTANISVDLKEGKAKARFYSCDISKKYITLNSYYTT